MLCSPSVEAELASASNTRESEVVFPNVLRDVMTRISVQEIVHVMQSIYETGRKWKKVTPHTHRMLTWSALTVKPWLALALQRYSRLSWLCVIRLFALHTISMLEFSR
jgi:hypothetical protein